MAVITPKLRRLMAETFLEKLANASTKNIYFFFGRSKPWGDPLSNIGVGNITLPLGSTTLTISEGNFSGIPESSTIKNLDTGEVRKVGLFSGTPPTQAVVNAPPSLAWSTSNWAWKSPTDGSVWNDDDNPPPPNGSQYNQNDSALTMLALKKINASALNDSVSYVIRRFDWDISGQTVYAMYRDNDGDLFNHPTQNDIDIRDRWNSQNPLNTYEVGSHWVIVHSGSNYHVFKCLDNNINASGLPNKSTIQPDKAQCTPANDYIHSASDGYKWKFLYTLSADQSLKFLTDAWVPVRVAIDPLLDPSAQNYEQWQVQQNATPGSIDVIRLIRCDNPVVYFGDTENGTTLLPDQSGLSSPSTQIQLPVTASTIDDYYSGCDIFVYDNNELQKIVNYDGVTQIATIDGSWTINPVENDAVCISPRINIVGSSELGGVSEAKARCVVNISGYISKILILNKGLYYRSASVTITSGIPEQNVAFAESEISPIENISPNVIGGHGYNAVKELGGFQLMFFTELHNIEGYQNINETYDFIQSNEYRSVGIVRNVQDLSGNYPTDNTLKAIKTLILSTPTGNPNFVQDEIIEYKDAFDNILAKGYVVEYIRDGINPDIGTLTYFQDLQSNFGPIVASSGVLYGLSSGAVATVTQVDNEEINIFSGDILYIEQRKPIVRASEQLENVKLTISF